MRQWVYSPCGTVLQSSLEIVCIVQYRESSTVQSRDSTFYGFHSTVLQYSFETVGLLLHMVLLQSGLETVLYSTAQKLVSRYSTVQKEIRFGRVPQVQFRINTILYSRQYSVQSRDIAIQLGTAVQFRENVIGTVPVLHVQFRWLILHSTTEQFRENVNLYSSKVIR